MEIPPLEEDTLTHILKSQWPSTYSMYKGTIKNFFDNHALYTFSSLCPTSTI